ncbi:hypothetical protein CBR_g40720 [Chara braunii]|uniref:Reverse transcriptase domain-containing protein n=1 Tax=Chara braunii TaxID=69332 RepID=A0A388LUB0_CHABU|nr:hypothetical protein CBR_g40720 [Chara braunii]|eukprot:GBG85908.1 hypothetical protein CBR_g40720 [Chara braunii]
MGICNAPATFQLAMNMTFQNFVSKIRLMQKMINFCVIVYMDDILVYSETYHGHAQHIEWTLGALRDAGFKIVLEKSEFFLSEISFLGYVVTRGGLRPDSRKVAAVKEAPVPTSLMQVRAFLGLASYYRCFIKGFAAIARPLTNLLRKDQPLSWDAECQQAFATLKDALATAPILIRPDPSKQFILITDWQPKAISAILVHKGNDGREHVIEYASRTVLDERRNDSAPQEFRFTSNPQVVVLAEATAFQRRAAPGISQVSTVVVFSCDITAFDPARQATIKSTLYRWGRDLATDWDRRFTRHGDECYPVDDIEVNTLCTMLCKPPVVLPELAPFQAAQMSRAPISTFSPPSLFPIFWQSSHYPRLSFRLEPLTVPLVDPDRWRLWRAKFVELSFCPLRVDLNWTWEGDQRPASEIVELLVIQAWRTNVAGDLLGFVFGAVDRGNRSQIVRELTIVIARLADELPLDIVSQSDEEPVPHTLSRTLALSLLWSACIEERWADDRFPSHSEYLDVHSLTNPRFFRQPTAFEWAALRAEEEAEEESEGELRREAGEAAARLAEDKEEEREAEEESVEAGEEEEEAKEETSEEEEEAYSEYTEGKQSEEEDEDDEEVESEGDEEPTHDELERVSGPDRREENPEAAAQRKKKIAEGKRLAIDPAPNDPFKDPEPPKLEHRDLAATTTRRRSRSRSMSPSASARPPIRQRVNEGLSPSSPIHIPPSP